MRRPGWNHLDRQLLLVLDPRSYATDPQRFGFDPNLAFHLPPREEANEVGLRAAWMQHRLLVRWRATNVAGAELARRYGASKQTWSRMALGERWAGQVLTSALLEATSRADKASKQRRD